MLLKDIFFPRFVSAGPDQRRTEVSDATGHVRGSYTYLDDKGVQHSVHYIAGPETGYRVLKHVKGPHLPTVFPFGRPEIIPPDFYDYVKDNDVFDTAASGHIKPGGSGGGKPTSGASIGGAKDEVPSFVNGLDDDKKELSFGNKKPFGGSKPGGGKPSYYDDDDSGDFGDIFGGGSSGSSSTPRPRPTGGYKPSRPSGNADDGSYKPSDEDGSYRPSISDIGIVTSTTFKPSYGGVTTSKPSSFRPDSSEGGYESGEKPFPSFDEVSTRPSAKPKPVAGRPSYGGGVNPSFDSKPSSEEFGRPSNVGSRPGSGTDLTSNEVNDFGLFGSESSRPRPPYGFGGKPTINIGVDNNVCSKCSTVVTNLGDKSFYVPPGVSVRAHVQAIDLLPVNPSIPSPSDQFNSDLKFKTEQLNAAEDGIIRNNVSNIQDTLTTTTTTLRTTQETKKSTTV